MTVLTLDLGTSATKAALWSGLELVELAQATVPTSNPEPGFAEQDPKDWWLSVVDACSRLRTAAPREYAAIESLGCSAARETFACFDRDLAPLCPGILWSDTRGQDQVALFGDPGAFRRRTGVLLTGGCQACKVAWIRQHEPAWFERADWILSPRDYVVARLTGNVETDPSLASRTGFYALDGEFIGDRTLAQRLPPTVPSLQVLPVPHARELALPSGVSAILGAGDRACEVIGVGAAVTAPMVSWGTTVNVSVPSPGPPDRLVAAQVSLDPVSGYVVEAGLSAGGAALDWLAGLTGRSSQELLTAAATVPPGANGVLALPWLQGARAPWWRPGSRAAFLGVTSAHGPPDLARALIEGVALDTARSVELITTGATDLLLAGAGARNSLWRSVLAAVTNCRTTVRAHTEAATVGARALVALAYRDRVELETLNPVRLVEQPQPALVEMYQHVRQASDEAALAILGED